MKWSNLKPSVRLSHLNSLALFFGWLVWIGYDSIIYMIYGNQFAWLFKNIHCELTRQAKSRQKVANATNRYCCDHSTRDARDHWKIHRHWIGWVWFRLHTIDYFWDLFYQTHIPNRWNWKWRWKLHLSTLQWICFLFFFSCTLFALKFKVVTLLHAHVRNAVYNLCPVVLVVVSRFGFVNKWFFALVFYSLAQMMIWWGFITDI